MFGPLNIGVQNFEAVEGMGFHQVINGNRWRFGIIRTFGTDQGVNEGSGPSVEFKVEPAYPQIFFFRFNHNISGALDGALKPE